MDVVVEDLRERVEHMKELSCNAEKFAHFNEDLEMPEVRAVQPSVLAALMYRSHCAFSELTRLHRSTAPTGTQAVTHTSQDAVSC